VENISVHGLATIFSTSRLPAAASDDVTSAGRSSSARLARKSVLSLGHFRVSCVWLGLGAPPGAEAVRRAGARPQPPSCGPRAPRLAARRPPGSIEVSEHLGPSPRLLGVATPPERPLWPSAPAVVTGPWADG
jgi:hypothetical protein